MEENQEEISASDLRSKINPKKSNEELEQDIDNYMLLVEALVGTALNRRVNKSKVSEQAFRNALQKVVNESKFPKHASIELGERLGTN
jgi:hypothetical protein